MTYLAIQFSKIYFKNKELVNENSFWKNLEDNLGSASKDIYAIHTSDFKDFFKPVGLEYFYKILESLKKISTSGKSIKCKRILIIYDKKQTKIEDTWIHTALVKKNEVKETERMFRNFYDMHEQNSIELFAVTIKKLCLILENIFKTSTDAKIKNQINSVCNNCFDPENILINKFEGLLINDAAYKPTSEFLTGMSFKSNKENEQLALMITKEIVADNPSRVKNII